MNGSWRRCNVCKREIPFEGRYYVCSVSTCNRKRTGLVFCSVECWDAHLPDARHRSDAGAIEEKAPSRAEAARLAEEEGRAAAPSEARTVRMAPPSGGGRPATASFGTAPPEPDVLVVASKVKKYIRDLSDMNTSASTLDALSRCVEALCGMAIENARTDGRKTVMDRDVPTVQRRTGTPAE